MPAHSIIQSLCPSCQETYRTTFQFVPCSQNCRQVLYDSLVKKAQYVGVCLEWQGHSLRGYGEINIGGKHWRVPRLAWTLFHGAIPEGLMVLHNCDNPPCLLDDHLFLGTGKANSEDMVAKGRSMRGERNPAHVHPERLKRGDNHPARLHPERMARGDRNGTHLHPETVARGERVATAKLTADQVRHIRLLRERNEMTQAAIGRLFGISNVMVGHIVHRTAWKHID